MVKTVEGQLARVTGPTEGCCGKELEKKQETRVADHHNVWFLEAR